MTERTSPRPRESRGPLRIRLLHGLAAVAAVAAMLVAAGPAPAQEAPAPPDPRFVATEIPASAAGLQLAWLIEATTRLPLAEEELRAHFTSSFLALPQASPAEVNVALQSSVDPAGARLVGISIVQPDAVVAVVTGRGGQELVLTLAVDDAGLIEYAALQPAAPGTEVRLPASTGLAAVGTDAVPLVDRARSGRRLMISRWYPAAPGARRRPLAAYASAPLSTALALPPVRVTARQGARPRPGRLPVVLFSPGFGTPRVIYQALAEDLASHGYLVLGVDHTGEAPMEFPDGSFALPSLPSGSPERLIADAAATRLADLRLILRRLNALPAGPRADRRRVAAIGHSLGGSTAAALMGAAPAIRAGVDMDGSIFGRAEDRGVARPFLVMAGWRGLDPSIRSFLRNSSGPLLALRFAGQEHLSFSDLPAIAPAALVGARRQPSVRDIAVQRIYLRAFLDRFVLDRPSPLLDGPSKRWPQVRFAYRERCCAAAAP